MMLCKCTVLAVAVGCGVTLIPSGGDKQPGPDDTVVKPFIAHLEKNGIRLERLQPHEWAVTDPKAAGYQVIVCLRTFPAGTTEQAMQNELKMHNLAYLLHAPARLAMSYPGLRSTDPASKLPSLD